MTGPGTASGLRSDDARRIDCPDCGARPVARCRGSKGQVLKNSHRSRVAAMREKLRDLGR
jgi:hypothetical protein